MKKYILNPQEGTAVMKRRPQELQLINLILFHLKACKKLALYEDGPSSTHY